MVEQSYSVEVEPFEGADNRSCFNQQKVQMDQPKLMRLPSSGLMTNQESLVVILGYCPSICLFKIFPNLWQPTIRET